MICDFLKRLKRRSAAFWILLAFSSPNAAWAAGPSYRRDIAPLLSERCSGCHLSEVKMGGLNLETYDGLMQGGSTGKAVIPGDASKSRLYRMVTAEILPAMPMNSSRLSDAEAGLIREWIDAGAKGPDEDQRSKGH